MRPTQTLHLLQRGLVFYERQIESFRDGLVRYIIVCGTNTAARDDEIIPIGHPSAGFDDIAFIVGDHFDAFEVYAEREAEFGEPA